MVLFAMMFKVLPDVQIGWRDVWFGAGVTAFLFVIGKYLIGLYLGRSGVSSSYGAAGSLVIILLWVYYSAMILFFGAELTQVYARRFGSKIVPSPEAVPTPDSKLHEEKTKSSQTNQKAGKPERLPWQHSEQPAMIGSLASLVLGIILGIFYSFRRKKVE
jgi:membrane protein